MSNVASVLKEEISRISRKEIRRETSSLKKSSTAHRSEIAALKRRVQELERQLRRVGRGGQSSLPPAANQAAVGGSSCGAVASGRGAYAALPCCRLRMPTKSGNPCAHCIPCGPRFCCGMSGVCRARRRR